MSSSPNARNNSGAGSSGIIRVVMGIIIFIVICIGLYYLYNFLYGSNVAKASVDILTGTPSMTADTVTVGTGKAVSATDLTGVMDGGQCSTSFWVYISDTKGMMSAGGAPLAHLMDISDDRFNVLDTKRGKTLLFVGLNPSNGTLVVRQSTNSSDTDVIDNKMTGGESATHYKLETLVSAYTSGSTYTTNDKCDITNGIEYQRWVLITTVANGRTLDVYIDGKLARSCVYKAAYSLGNEQGKGKAVFGYNNQQKLKGFFSSGKFYNYALTPDAIWALYQQGPGDTFNISNFFSNLFSINVNFKVNSDLIPSV